MIGDNYKYIFVHIPKNGGSSIEKELFDYYENKDKIFNKDCYSMEYRGSLKKYGCKKHSTLRHIKTQLPLDKYNSYLKFSLVRNPYDRFISCYYWSFYSDLFKLHILDKKIRRRLVRDICYKEDFLKIYNNAKSMSEQHILCMDWADIISQLFFARSQFQYITLRKRNINVNYVLYLEHINDGWEIICNKLNIVNNLEHFRKNENKKDYSFYYENQPEFIDFVKGVYRKDFLKLRYNPNDIYEKPSRIILEGVV